MISVDTVYQRILALANKEQRGYVTPLEFNLLANQAQLLIFEQYFYDLDKAKQKDSDTSSFSDLEELIQNKLAPFISTQAIAAGVFPANAYRVGKIFVGEREAVKVDVNEAKDVTASAFHSIGLTNNPIYTDSTAAGVDVRFYGGIANASTTCEVVMPPQKAEWGYDVIQSKALYNASRSTPFQLHASEEAELVNKILVLAGIVMNKVGLANTAISLDQAQILQEKQ
jgi:hypothetical protein